LRKGSWYGALFLLFSFTAGSAIASCGSSSCPIDLHALQLGDAGSFSLDLSFQYIDQDQPRIGSRRAHVGEIASDHDEIRTINRLTTLQLSYAMNDRFQIALAVPYVSRSHEHFDEETAQIERWHFGNAGDATLQARLRLFSNEPTHSSIWLTGGAKFATGSRRETGTGGGDAEVTITPGTGSTDALLGITYQSGFLRDTKLEGPMGHATLIPLFIAINSRINGRGTSDYRRGNEVQLNAGTEYPLTESLHLLGQLNGRIASKDDVGATDENRDLTGGRYVYLSPGLRVAMSHRTSIYGFVQFPIYQRVNGIQLTSKANYVAGIRRSF
jgi:hypothetical protein